MTDNIAATTNQTFTINEATDTASSSTMDSSLKEFLTVYQSLLIIAVSGIIVLFAFVTVIVISCQYRKVVNKFACKEYALSHNVRIPEEISSLQSNTFPSNQGHINHSIDPASPIPRATTTANDYQMSQRHNHNFANSYLTSIQEIPTQDNTSIYDDVLEQDQLPPPVPSHGNRPRLSTLQKPSMRGRYT